MSYYFNTILKERDFATAIEIVTKVLKEHGFGVVTEIDVKATFKKKIDVDFRPYHILGACHPEYAYQAISKENKIGVFLPCNLVVEENEDGKIEVSAVDPIASMQSVDNPDLGEFVFKVKEQLLSVIDVLKSK